MTRTATEATAAAAAATTATIQLTLESKSMIGNKTENVVLESSCYWAADRYHTAMAIGMNDVCGVINYQIDFVASERARSDHFERRVVSRDDDGDGAKSVKFVDGQRHKSKQNKLIDAMEKPLTRCGWGGWQWSNHMPRGWWWCTHQQRNHGSPNYCLIEVHSLRRPTGGHDDDDDDDNDRVLNQKWNLCQNNHNFLETNERLNEY